MKNIIINADDCGISKKVNACIEEAILLNRISSTTIIANMDDFDGAVSLYKKYHKQISFGWHINLDDGEPLTRSQLLLDTGFFIQREDHILLNGGKYNKRFFKNEMLLDIKKELCAQWDKINSSGIEISHIDSHHYYHSQLCMIQVLPSLLKDLKIERCRHVANYGYKGINAMARKAWAYYYKKHGLRMPDTFCSFNQYYQNRFLKQGKIVELMCHPGHTNPNYEEEYELVKTTDLKEWHAKLITYLDI